MLGSSEENEAKSWNYGMVCNGSIASRKFGQTDSNIFFFSKYIKIIYIRTTVPNMNIKLDLESFTNLFCSEMFFQL